MKFTLPQAIAWAAATLVASITLMSGAYATFQTKSEARVRNEALARELGHIRVELKELNKWLRENPHRNQ